MMKPNAGFVGLGEMGKWMAINVLKAGYPLMVYDINPVPVKELVSLGALEARALALMAREVDYILLSLPGTEIVQKVLFDKEGIMEDARPGLVVVDLSTTHPLKTRDIEKTLREEGVTFIDAPVSGMEARAKEGTLTIMAGGEETTFRQIEPLLSAVANKIVYMGGSGNGQLTKLANQILFNISAAAMAEILPLAVKMGLDPEKVCEVVKTGTGNSYALEFFSPHILNNHFKIGYTLKNAYKDMVNVFEMSASEKIPLPVTNGAMVTYQMALAEGLGDEGKGAMIKVWEKALGVKVRKRNRKG
jgi:3-hydroxyisobutyrate dehydrogenase-like beta-hydroxyacid dehydrogenase